MAHRDRAFTMFEGMIIICVVAILVAVLWQSPMIKRPPPPRWVGCMQNMKQLDLAWIMYSSDNRDALPLAEQFTNSQTNVWALGNAQTVSQDTARYGQLEPGVLDATNLNALTRGVLFEYVKSPKVYRCSQDPRTVGGVPYVRSYSMNNWMNGKSPAAWIPGLSTSNRVYQKIADIPGPAYRFVFIDEDPASINETMFTVIVDPGQFLSHIPTRNHERNGEKYYLLSFADGHVEASKFMCADTLAWNPSKPRLPEIVSGGVTNQDVVKLRTTAYAPW